MPTLKKRLEWLRSAENLQLTDAEIESMYDHVKRNVSRLRTSGEIQLRLGELPRRDVLLLKAFVCWALDVVEREETTAKPEWLAALAANFDGDGEGLPTMTGYDDCVIGVCTRYGQEPIIAYSYEKVIEKLVTEGMAHDEAVEWFEFNMIGAWIGNKTYCFITTA
jgi:hypothetical protein